MNAILGYLETCAEYLRLRGALEAGEGPVSVFGLGEAHRAHVAAALGTVRALLYIAANEQTAARAAQEMAALGADALYFAPRDEKKVGEYAASGEITARRLEILTTMAQRRCVTVSMRGLLQSMAAPQTVQDATYRFVVGDQIEPQTLMELLVRSGYTRADLCEGRGQAALRGGYLDVFPLTAQDPVRLEFFDDEIDTMRRYDPLTQRSIENVAEVVIPPAAEAAASGCCLLDYLLPDTLLFLDEPARLEESAKVAYEEDPSLNSPLQTIKRLDTPRTLMSFALTRSYSLIAPRALFHFDTRAATLYAGNEESLREDLAAWKTQGYAVVLCAGPHAQRMQDRLADMDILAPVIADPARPLVRGETIVTGAQLNRGFIYPEYKLAVLSEQELYGAVRQVRQSSRKRPQLAFSELSVGDLIVHELYGVGRFAGVETLTVGAEKTARDYLLLQYAGGDKLYIPTDQLDRVQKYIGGADGEDGGGGGVKLSKLGSGEWQKTVTRTRESVKKLAFDLAALYGERSRRKGFAFSVDTVWQRRLEENFPYEETPDQLRCIQEIKADMESARVMDRLLCGDVGYGKTEVAIRACFKAAQDSKQAAILVPTTILAQQHYNTLRARFANFPVEVALLSRFNTPAEEKRTLERLQSGAIDVVVGTHKLLSKQVKFHDLGLLVVDEEQRFGVGHKEQIKELKKNVDVLTLSATPIPRTLHMSMTGIRDMSLLETPPAERYPVQTYVLEYNEAMVREAICKELGRGGQVYFLYNRVRSMESFCERLRALVPEARIAFAHGQMPERTLEKTMLDFMEGNSDVLVCSTIIENGLDISNVNTIIVYDADYMGLSQLYQLRGRVGRDVRLGYAYLTFRRDKVLTEVAEKRLSAIREFTQFGSGFKVAMRDLEIRGAGNMLGPEQHGHMAAVGYEMYCKLVDEAVHQAKGEPLPKQIDTVMEVPLTAFIPHDYIPRETDRLSMYKRIALIDGSDSLMDVQDELIDRFGEIPLPVRNLMDIALLKAAAGKAYITRVQIAAGEVRLSFDPEAPLNGAKLLAAAQQNGAQFKQGETPLLLLKRKGEEPAAICRTLPQFFYTLVDCIDAQA